MNIKTLFCYYLIQMIQADLSYCMFFISSQNRKYLILVVLAKFKLANRTTKINKVNSNTLPLAPPHKSIAGPPDFAVFYARTSKMRPRNETRFLILDVRKNEKLANYDTGTFRPV